jgi:putative transposase
MPRRPHVFEIGHFYHVFNRGVEKRDIFLDDVDRYQFLLCLAYYQQVGKIGRLSRGAFEIHDRQEPFRFKIHAYCLMDNHYHLLLEECVKDGIREGLRHAFDSYVSYFNKKRERAGTLFQGRFKSVPVETNEQFMHVARYIFLNRFVAGLEDRIGTWPWNGYREYMQSTSRGLATQDTLLGFLGNDRTKLQKFVQDHADYARSLDRIKHLMFE